MLVDCQPAATLHLGTLSAWELRVLSDPNYRLREGTFRVFAKLNSPKTVKSEATATRPSPAARSAFRAAGDKALATACVRLE